MCVAVFRVCVYLAMGQQPFQVTFSHISESVAADLMLNRNRAYVKRAENRAIFWMFVGT
jgi:hypothetical protein